MRYLRESIVVLVLAIAVLNPSNVPALAKFSPKNKVLDFPTYAGEWKNEPPAFSSIVYEETYSYKNKDGTQGYVIIAKQDTCRDSAKLPPILDISNRPPAGILVCNQTYNRYDSGGGETNYGEGDDVFGFEAYGNFGYNTDLASVNCEECDNTYKNQIVSNTYKGNFPYDKGSKSEINNPYYANTRTFVSLGEVNKYPEMLRPYAPIIAIGGPDGRLLGYWSKTLRAPVMGINPGNGSVQSVVVGVTIGEKHFGKTYEQVAAEARATPIGVAALEYDRQKSEQDQQQRQAERAANTQAMLNQFTSGIATLGSQMAVGNVAVSRGHAAPVLIVPNVSAPDGGASAISLNQQIIDATLSEGAEPMQPPGAYGRSGARSAMAARAPSFADAALQRPAAGVAPTAPQSQPSYRNRPELQASQCLAFHGPIDLYGERVTNSCGYTVAFAFCVDGASSALACKKGEEIGAGADSIGAGKTQDTGFLDAKGEIHTWWIACRGKLGDVSPKLTGRARGQCMSY